jgi:hypothetical protein
VPGGPIRGPYGTKMVSILRALFPNLENISLPDWWPGVAALTERRLEFWPMLKTLAVGTVPSVAAILHEIESERTTCLVLQGMAFPECTDPKRYWGIQGYPRIPHIWHLLSLI